jgi:hypothetical protein
MQITAQATTLFLPRRDEPLTRTLQISGKTHSVDSNTCLSSEIIQQPMIGSSEELAMYAWNEEQFADRLSLIDERQAERRIQRSPVGRCKSELVTLLQRNRGIRQLECLGNGLNNRRQHSLRRKCGFQALS